MSKDKVRLEALDYAEKNKIVNQKTIQAYIDGYYSRNNLSFEEQIGLLLSYANSVDRLKDAGYSDARGAWYNEYRKCDVYWKEIQEKLKRIKEIVNEKDFW